MEKKIYDLLIHELNKTIASDDVPVAALLVDENNQIVAISHNTRELTIQITGHAEISLINEMCIKNHCLKLENYTLYSTLEPCSMCYSAAKQANIKQIYYLLDNQKNHDTKLLTFHNNKLKMSLFGTQKMQENYKKIINTFFENHRK